MTRIRAMISRIGALGLLGILLWAAWQFAVEPVRDYVLTIDGQIDLNKQVIGRLMRGISDGDGGESQLRAAHDEVTGSGRFVVAETAPLAAARLQQHLETIVASEGGELQSVQSLPSKDDSGLTRIGLRVMMRGDYDALLRVLYSLEAENPTLFIDSVQIKAERARRRIGAADETEGMVLIFEIFGYLPPGAGA